MQTKTSGCGFVKAFFINLFDDESIALVYNNSIKHANIIAEGATDKSDNLLPRLPPSVAIDLLNTESINKLRSEFLSKKESIGIIDPKIAIICLEYDETGSHEPFSVCTMFDYKNETFIGPVFNSVAHVMLSDKDKGYTEYQKAKIAEAAIASAKPFCDSVIINIPWRQKKIPIKTLKRRLSSFYYLDEMKRLLNSGSLGMEDYKLASALIFEALLNDRGLTDEEIKGNFKQRLCELVIDIFGEEQPEDFKLKAFCAIKEVLKNLDPQAAYNNLPALIEYMTEAISRAYPDKLDKMSAFMKDARNQGSSPLSSHKSNVPFFPTDAFDKKVLAKHAELLRSIKDKDSEMDPFEFIQSLKMEGLESRILSSEVVNKFFHFSSMASFTNETFLSIGEIIHYAPDTIMFSLAHNPLAKKVLSHNLDQSLIHAMLDITECWNENFRRINPNKFKQTPAIERVTLDGDGMMGVCVPVIFDCMQDGAVDNMIAGLVGIDEAIRGIH